MRPTPILLFLFTFIVYGLSSQGEGAKWNYFILIADAFLHGQLNITNPPSWINELVFWKGAYYSVFPPMPAFLFIPFVAIFGKEFYQPFLSIFLGAFNVSLAFTVIFKIFKQTKIALWMSFLYGFGTIQWYHAEVGSAWYVAHIVAMFFLWLLILESLTKQRLFIMGLLIGFAYLSRIPTILSVIFVIIFLHDRFLNFENKRLQIFIRPLVIFLLGVLPALLISFLYNFIRFGVIFDISYSLLPIFKEPWYQYGLINIKYIPIHLKEMFFSMPKFSLQPPFVIPNLFSMAVWLITPTYVLIFFANFKNIISIASLTTAIFISIPELMHGGNGFTQFGYRHTMDFLPFLIILIASGLENKFNFFTKLLIILSVLVNFWGVVMISFLNIWVI